MKNKKLDHRDYTTAKLLGCLDFFLTLFAWWAVFHSKINIEIMFSPIFDQIPWVVGEMKYHTHIVSVILIIIVLPVFLVKLDFYRRFWTMTLSEYLVRLFHILFWITVGFFALGFVFDYPRSYLLFPLFVALVAIIFIGLRCTLFRIFVKHLLKYQNIKERTIFIGKKSLFNDFWQVLSKQEKSLIDPINYTKYLEEDFNVLASLIRKKSVCKIIVLTESIGINDYKDVIILGEEMGVDVCLNADFMKYSLASLKLDYLDKHTLLCFEMNSKSFRQRFWKIIADKVVALVMLILIFPIGLIIAALIKITSPKGSVFYVQDRAGKYGKSFKMVKFRTMRLNAENELEKLKISQGNDMDGPVFKLENDPRIMAFGRFLRKYSLDELPQLWNVLIGQMSLVGPRPLPCYEIEAFEKRKYWKRLSVRPGITGLWQVKGRSEISNFDEWVSLDLKYINEWSFSLDFKILCKTIIVVLLAKGAK